MFRRLLLRPGYEGQGGPALGCTGSGLVRWASQGLLAAHLQHQSSASRRLTSSAGSATLETMKCKAVLKFASSFPCGQRAHGARSGGSLVSSACSIASLTSSSGRKTFMSLRHRCSFFSRCLMKKVLAMASLQGACWGIPSPPFMYTIFITHNEDNAWGVPSAEPVVPSRQSTPPNH